MKNWLVLVIIAAIIWLFLAPIFGITGSTLTVGLFTVSILFIMKYFKFTSKYVSAIPFSPKFAGIIGICLLVFGMFSYGWFSQWIPLTLNIASAGGATYGTTYPAPSSGGVACSPISKGGNVPDEVFGTSSSLVLNAYDMEATQPKSSTVDLTTNCAYFISGEYGGLTADTADPTAISGFGSVGKIADVYCGGASYYTEPIVGKCIDNAAVKWELLTHNAVAETDLAITGYDKTAATALTAGTSSEDDYTMALGANQEDLIYLQLQQNSASQEYAVGAVGVVRFYNISKVEPQAFSFNGKQYTWSIGLTPEHMKSITVNYNETTTEQGLSKDYTVYYLSEPLILHAWEYVKIPFKITSDTTNNPNGGGGTSAVDGFAILFKDSQWARGGDGFYHRNIYQMDTAQADIGVAETETSPLGKAVGIVVEVT